MPGDLLRRVFAVEVLVCERCAGRMRVMATLRSPQAVARFLEAATVGQSSPARQVCARLEE